MVDSLKSEDDEANEIIGRLRRVAMDLKGHDVLIAAIKDIAGDLVKLGDRAIKDRKELEDRVDELESDVNELEQAAMEFRETEGVIEAIAESIAEAVYDFDRGLKDKAELLDAVRRVSPDRV